ncbi:hypothetical protein [Maricaulis sp.]|uniref:hypothetical protein n=1 Tax=Maricaulis sp. TaxID=1486257 RepID=UPI002632AF08|nr:hypothetical protein [Maricaulis sp.]MDF1769874.1 hypothetical protein [Maricaulis sp.]
MPETDNQAILIQTMRDYGVELRGMREDFKSLATRLASVQTLTNEIAETRHQLRDELGNMISKGQLDVQRAVDRIAMVELELARKKGREEVIQWLAGGSSVAGLVSVVSIVWRFMQ